MMLTALITQLGVYCGRLPRPGSVNTNQFCHRSYYAFLNIRFIRFSNLDRSLFRNQGFSQLRLIKNYYRNESFSSLFNQY